VKKIEEALSPPKSQFGFGVN